MESKNRREYSREFKEEAVRMVTEGGRKVAVVARNLGIHENMLHAWKRNYLKDAEERFPGKGKLKPSDEDSKATTERSDRSEGGARDLKKSVGHLLKAPKMKYRFIQRYSSEFAVKKMCNVLGVSRSGYYGWKKQPQSNRQKDNDKLLVYIKESHKQSNKTYGSPRIAEDLWARGMVCGENRVARIMRENGIVAKTKKKFKATTNSRHTLPVAENLVDQNFTADGPNKLWVSDITYIPTMEGWLYLAVILDVFSRQVVGWSMSKRLRADFVIKALYHAIGRRKPAGNCVFHSDQEVQYACSDFLKVLKAYGFTQSMSRKGNCYDNAVAESFFHTLKTEHVYFHRYRTRAEAQQSMFEYIEMFYNRQRRHSALGYRSPVSFELGSLAA